jgi:hypothetical protein
MTETFYRANVGRFIYSDAAFQRMYAQTYRGRETKDYKIDILRRIQYITLRHMHEVLNENRSLYGKGGMLKDWRDARVKDAREVLRILNRPEVMP